MHKFTQWIFAGIAGYGFHGVAQTTSNPNPTTQVAAPGMVSPVTDGQIVSILTVVNAGESDMGKLAVEKAQNPQVKKFAQQMVVDHTRSDSDTKKFLEKSNVEAQNFAKADDLKATAEREKARLQQLSGAEFDKAYIESQISMHKEVLNTIDKQLLPGAQAKGTKNLLQQMRPKIESHLRHAESLKAKLM